MLSLEMRRKRGRRKPRSLQVELGKTISETRRIFKGSKKVWPQEDFRTDLRNLKLSYAKSLGKKNKMIRLLNSLVKAKSSYHESCQNHLSSLKKQQADAAQESIPSRKSIIKKLLKDLRNFAHHLEVSRQANYESSMGHIEDYERTYVEVTGMVANSELKKRAKHKLLVRSLDKAVKEMEELISFF